MPKVFDCFIFFNELDLLEVRFEELGDVVDHFILIEGEQTFRGDSKPSYFTEALGRYNKFLGRVDAYSGPLRGHSPWAREAYQRNAIAVALRQWNPEPDDIIIISDADEIPRSSVIGPVAEVTGLRLKKFSYGINMLTDEGNTAVRILPYSKLTSPQEIRRSVPTTFIEDAGWEFSSLGSVEDILKKLKSFSHAEFDTPDLTLEVLLERMSRGQDIVGRDMFHKIVEVDDTWPRAMKNNREYWSRYEWKLG